MRIDLQDLSSVRFALELPDKANRPRALVLQDTQGLRGVYESTAEHIVIESARADSTRVAGLDWRTASVHVLMSSVAEIVGLAVDLRLARRDDGTRLETATLVAERVDGATLSFEYAGRRLAGALRVFGLRLTQDAAALSVDCAELVVSEAQTVLAGLLARVASVSVSRAAVTVTESAAQVTLGRLSVTRLCVAGDGLQCEIEGLEFERGLSVTPTSTHDVLHVPEVSLTRLKLSTSDVTRWPTRRAPATNTNTDTNTDTDTDTAAQTQEAASQTQVPQETPSQAPQQPGRGRVAALSEILDLSQLDRLSGKLHVDVRVEVSLPVIGRRAATHEFRVAIADGMINFKQLERGLSALEDAVLDFEVKGNTLVLEQDIPIVGKKDLVVWPLHSERDRRLSRKKTVRLVILSSPEFPATRGGGVSFDIKHVGVSGLDLGLSATRHDGGPTVDTGAITDIELGKLRVRGAVQVVARAQAQAHGSDNSDNSDGELEVVLESLCFRVRDLDLGDVYIESAQVCIERIEGARIGFAGLSLRTASVNVDGIRLQDVRIRRARRARRAR